MPSPRRLLEKHGLAAQKGRGQNFLADPTAARTIIERAALPPEGRVLEIGPGLGALTRPLLEAGHHVVAVEVDLGLVRFLEEELLPDYPDRLTIVAQDILQVDLAEAAGDSFSVVGNLPYVISTPLLFKILDSRRVVTDCTLMFQRELAERLTAGPGTKTFGRLSVVMGYFADIRKLMDLGPEVFYPRPKVGSRVLHLTFKNDPWPELKSAPLFKQVVAAGFSRRRKTLSNALKSMFSGSEIEAALEKTGIDPKRRAETLTIEEFVALANAMERPGP